MHPCKEQNRVLALGEQSTRKKHERSATQQNHVRDYIICVVYKLQIIIGVLRFQYGRLGRLQAEL